MVIDGYAAALIRAASPFEVLALMMRQAKAVARTQALYLVASLPEGRGWTFLPFVGADLLVAVGRRSLSRDVRQRMDKVLELAGLALQRLDTGALLPEEGNCLEGLAICLQETCGWPCAIVARDGSTVAASPDWNVGGDNGEARRLGPQFSWGGRQLQVVFGSGPDVLAQERLDAAARIVERWGSDTRETTQLPRWKTTSIVGSRAGFPEYFESLEAAVNAAMSVLGVDAAAVVARRPEGLRVEVSAGAEGESLARFLVSGSETGWLYRPALVQAAELNHQNYTLHIRPLMVGERSLGLFAVATRHGPLKGRGLEMLDTFDALLSLLMISRLLEEELARRIDETDLLWEATENVVQLKRPEHTLAELAETWRRLARADLLAVFLSSDDGRLIPKVLHGVPCDVAIDPLTTASVEALVRGAMVVSYPRGAGRAYSLPGNLADLAQAYHLALFYLRVDVPVAAVLLARKGPAFTGRELRTMAIVFRQVAVALRNAQLYYSADYERSLLRTLFDQASDGLMLVDNHLRVVGFNKAMENITGWKANELIGRECREFFACQDPQGGPMCADGCPALQAIWSHGQLPYVELRVVDRNGRPKDLAVSFSFVASPLHPDAAYSLAIVRDVTEVKAAERVRNQLVSAVSHELRTPLSALKASISLLRAALPETSAQGQDPIARLVDNAERAVDRLTKIVEDALDLARAQAGKLVLRQESVDLSNLVSGVVTALQPLAASRDQRIVAIGTERPIWLVGDRSRLEQVLTNLVSNALKYSPEGTQVDVEVQASGGVVRLVIGDRGPGVPLEEQRAIFEPFYRGERTRGNTVGSGLGLAVARSLVELHGGRISVRNRPGGGALFSVELPVSAPTESEATTVDHLAQ